MYSVGKGRETRHSRFCRKKKRRIGGATSPEAERDLGVGGRGKSYSGGKEASQSWDQGMLKRKEEKRGHALPRRFLRTTWAHQKKEESTPNNFEKDGCCRRRIMTHQKGKKKGSQQQPRKNRTGFESYSTKQPKGEEKEGKKPLFIPFFWREVVFFGIGLAFTGGKKDHFPPERTRSHLPYLRNVLLGTKRGKLLVREKKIAYYKTRKKGNPLRKKPVLSYTSAKITGEGKG